jgi:hypothetical protein
MNILTIVVSAFIVLGALYVVGMLLEYFIEDFLL